MKKRILNLIVVLVFGSISIFAGNTTTITPSNAKSLIVDTKDWKSAFISVEIRDSEGSIVFLEKYSTQVGKRFNFENLPKGKYSIIFSDNYKSTEQFFTLNTNELIVLPNIVTLFKPVINVTEDFIDFNYLAPGKKTTISISDDFNDFFTLNINNEKNINKRFDTRNLPKGTYHITVYSKNSSYSKTFYK